MIIANPCSGCCRDAPRCTCEQACYDDPTLGSAAALDACLRGCGTITECQIGCRETYASDWETCRDERKVCREAAWGVWRGCVSGCETVECVDECTDARRGATSACADTFTDCEVAARRARNLCLTGDENQELFGTGGCISERNLCESAAAALECEECEAPTLEEVAWHYALCAEEASDAEYEAKVACGAARSACLSGCGGNIPCSELCNSVYDACFWEAEKAGVLARAECQKDYRVALEWAQHELDICQRECANIRLLARGECYSTESRTRCERQAEADYNTALAGCTAAWATDFEALFPPYIADVGLCTEGYYDRLIADPETDHAPWRAACEAEALAAYNYEWKLASNRLEACRRDLDRQRLLQIDQECCGEEAIITRGEVRTAYNACLAAAWVEGEDCVAQAVRDGVPAPYEACRTAQREAEWACWATMHADDLRAQADATEGRWSPEYLRCLAPCLESAYMAIVHCRVEMMAGMPDGASPGALRYEAYYNCIEASGALPTLAECSMSCCREAYRDDPVIDALLESEELADFMMGTTAARAEILDALEPPPETAYDRCSPCITLLGAAGNKLREYPGHLYFSSVAIPASLNSWACSPLGALHSFEVALSPPPEEPPE